MLCLQQTDVPFAPGPEAEVVPDAHGFDTAVHQHLEEVIGTHGCQIPGKRNVHQDIHAQVHHQLHLAAIVQQPGRFQFRFQAGQGMGTEGKDHQLQIVLPGIGPGGPDDFLMSQMDSVKGPQRSCRRQEMGRMQFIQ